jgi:hypothetical protein
MRQTDPDPEWLVLGVYLCNAELIFVTVIVCQQQPDAVSERESIVDLVNDSHSDAIDKPIGVPIHFWDAVTVRKQVSDSVDFGNEHSVAEPDSVGVAKPVALSVGVFDAEPESIFDS